MKIFNRLKNDGREEPEHECPPDCPVHHETDEAIEPEETP
jgi:hypothetical protein